MHKESHPLAGKTVKLKPIETTRDGITLNAEYIIEDWWDLLTGESWMWSKNNFAAMKYAMRGIPGKIPIDDEVVYGKLGGLGHLIHVSELGEVVSNETK